MPTFSQIGSTTSTILSSSGDVPPGISTPDVIVVVTLLFGLTPSPAGPLSVAIPDFTATVITPL